ncbi:MAG: helix-turn-helix transcriptional regulator [Acidobacteriota bacterium]|nr:MAG: helix-turn-helix transcriptional regulator [Acidobacteriota bacterium]
MKAEKRKKLEAAGWTAGSAGDFLELTPQEEQYIEIKLLLSESLRKERLRHGLSQEKLASLIKSSQSRVAKMEANDPSVSVDLLLKALLATGATREDLAEILASAA